MQLYGTAKEWPLTLDTRRHQERPTTTFIDTLNIAAIDVVLRIQS